MKVLVVDDEPLVVWSLVRAIERLNCHVDWAISGTDAISKIERDLYDIVITDYRMPDLNGVEVVRKTREKNPSAMILVITAYSGEDELMNAVKSNLIHKLVEKPYNLEDVLKFIKEVRDKNE